MTGQTRANYSETKLAQTDPCMWTRRCTDAQAQAAVPPPPRACHQIPQNKNPLRRLKTDMFYVYGSPHHVTLSYINILC